MKPVLLAVVLLSAMALADCKRPPTKPRPVGSAHHLVMQPEYVASCSENLTVLIENVEFKKVGNLVIVNGESELNRNVDRLTKIVANIKNCDDSNTWTCKHFQTWRYGRESCAMVGKKDVFWTPFMESFHPEMKCPFRKGRFVLRNGTIDVELLRRLPFPLEQYLWRVQIEAYDPSERIMCIDANLRFVRESSKL